MHAKSKRNSAILILTAFIWGVAFVAQSEGGKAAGPYTFNCIRSIIGSVVLIPAIMVLDKLNLTSKKSFELIPFSNVFFLPIYFPYYYPLLY